MTNRTASRQAIRQLAARYRGQRVGLLGGIERIRKASDDILAGGVAAIGQLDAAPELLAQTDTVVEEVADGAVRYAGSVAKLLPEE